MKTDSKPKPCPLFFPEVGLAWRGVQSLVHGCARTRTRIHTHARTHMHTHSCTGTHMCTHKDIIKGPRGISEVSVFQTAYTDPRLRGGSYSSCCHTVRWRPAQPLEEQVYMGCFRALQVGRPPPPPRLSTWNMFTSPASCCKRPLHSARGRRGFQGRRLHLCLTARNL